MKILFSILLLTAMLVLSGFSDFSRTDCEFAVIPDMVIDTIQVEDGGAVEIIHQNQDGSVSALFMNKLYLEGWFYVIDGQVCICDVSYILKLDEEGKAIFAYWSKWRG